MSYAANADNHAEELRDSFSQEDIAALRLDLESMGTERWLRSTDENRHEANEYLRGTEKQRSKKKNGAIQSRVGD